MLPPGGPMPPEMEGVLSVPPAAASESGSGVINAEKKDELSCGEVCVEWCGCRPCVCTQDGNWQWVWDDTPAPKGTSAYGLVWMVIVFAVAALVSVENADLGPLSGCPRDFLSLFLIGFVAFEWVCLVGLLCSRRRALCLVMMGSAAAITTTVLVYYAGALGFAIAIYGSVEGMRCGGPLGAGLGLFSVVAIIVTGIWLLIYCAYESWKATRDRLRAAHADRSADAAARAVVPSHNTTNTTQAPTSSDK